MISQVQQTVLPGLKLTQLASTESAWNRKRGSQRLGTYKESHSGSCWHSGLGYVLLLRPSNFVSLAYNKALVLHKPAQGPFCSDTKNLCPRQATWLYVPQNQHFTVLFLTVGFHSALCLVDKHWFNWMYCCLLQLDTFTICIIFTGYRLQAFKLLQRTERVGLQQDQGMFQFETWSGKY